MELLMRLFRSLFLSFIFSFGFAYVSHASNADNFALNFAEIFAEGEIISEDELIQILENVIGVRYPSALLDSEGKFTRIEGVHFYHDPFRMNLKPIGSFQSEGETKNIDSYDSKTGVLNISEAGGMVYPYTIKLVEFNGERVLMFALINGPESIYGYFLHRKKS